MLVADVSGKGVPAAMFMMRAKTLIKSAAQTGKPLAQVFNEANEALCEGNTSSTFVTVWAGELNLHTGHLTFVNAGHNPPVVRSGNRCEYLKTRPSPALGAMEGVDDITLAPGDALYRYTDGIVEQPAPSGELYGEERLLGLLSRNVRQRGEILKTVLSDVRRHAAGAEQADDCTQLVLRYRGEPDVVAHEYAPTLEDVAKAVDELTAALETVPVKERARLLVAADEIFANIVRYSGATRWSLSVELDHHPDGVRLVITDNGKPFDPLAQRDPDTTLAAEDRAVGGLGIFIVKKTMSPVTYKRRSGLNILKMGKDYGD